MLWRQIRRTVLSNLDNSVLTGTNYNYCHTFWEPSVSGSQVNMYVLIICMSCLRLITKLYTLLVCILNCNLCLVVFKVWSTPNHNQNTWLCRYFPALYYFIFSIYVRHFWYRQQSKLKKDSDAYGDRWNRQHVFHTIFLYEGC